VRIRTTSLQSHNLAGLDAALNFVPCAFARPAFNHTSARIITLASSSAVRIRTTNLQSPVEADHHLCVGSCRAHSHDQPSITSKS